MCILLLWIMSLYFMLQVDEEYKTPGSQKREAVGKLPQMWGQSLYVLASLVKEVCNSCCVLAHENAVDTCH